MLVVALVMIYFNRGSLFGSTKRPQNAELAWNSKTIDIDSMTRAIGGGGEKKPIYLERGREALTIQLPVGSKAGTYAFQLRNQANQVLVSKSAAATIANGVTSFRVNVDLSGLQPGQYSMEVRQVPWDWEYFPVVLR